MTTEVFRCIATINESMKQLSPAALDADCMISIEHVHMEEANTLVPYRVIQALRQRKSDSPEPLLCATKIVLQQTLGFEVTEAQALFLLRFVFNNKAYECARKRNLQICVKRDGSLTTAFKEIAISYQAESWWIHYNAQQYNLDEAIRVADVIARGQQQHD